MIEPALPLAAGLLLLLRRQLLCTITPFSLCPVLSTLLTPHTHKHKHTEEENRAREGGREQERQRE